MIGDWMMLQLVELEGKPEFFMKDGAQAWFITG
jgi:hypothetical protein